MKDRKLDKAKKDEEFGANKENKITTNTFDNINGQG
jgi:hypothetical protein